MAEKGGEAVSPPEAANVRVVRCPKCGKLLPELAGFKVYRCGGCNATLQAKRRISTKTVSPENSRDGNMRMTEDGNMRKPEPAAVTPYSKNKVHSSENQAVVPDSNIGGSSDSNGVFLNRAGEINGSPASGTDSNDYRVVSDEDGTVKSDYPGEESKKGFGDGTYQHAPKSPVYHFNLVESDDSKVFSKADDSTTCDNSAKESPTSYKRASNSPVRYCNPKLDEWDESKVYVEEEDTISGAYPAEESRTRYKNGDYLHATNASVYHSYSYLNELDESKVFAIVDDTMPAFPTEESRKEYGDSRHQRASKSPVYYSNTIEENCTETRDNQYQRTSKPPAYDASLDVDEMPKMHSKKKGHNNLQYYGPKKVQAEPVSRSEDNAMGSLLTPRGLSQGRFTNRERGIPFGLPDSMYSRREHQDPDGVKNLEPDTAEILKTLDGIRDQLSQPYEPPVIERPNEVASSRNVPVFKNAYRTNSNELLYETSHHYIHKPDLDNSGLLTQDSVRGYGETFGSQAMQRSRVPYQNPSQHLQRQSTNLSYEQLNRNPGKLHTQEAFYHQPSCSCQRCHSHLQMPSHDLSTGFRSRKHPYVPNIPSFNSVNEHPVLQSRSSNIKSSLGSLGPRYLNRSIPTNVHMRGCRPLAGGSPFIMCHNCFELLQLPCELLSNGMHQKRLECGSCSQVITFKIAGKRLVVHSPAANVVKYTGCSDHVNKMVGSPSTEFHVNLDPAVSQFRSHVGSSSSAPPVNETCSRPSPTNPTRDAVMEDHSIKLEKREGVSPSKVHKDEDFTHAQFCKKDLSNSSEFSRKSRLDTFMHNDPSNKLVKSPQSDLAPSPEVRFLHSPSSPTPNAAVEEHYADLSESENMEGHSPTSKISEDVLNVRSYEKDVPYSPAFSNKSGVVISTRNLPSNEHNLALSAEVCSISNCFEERISIDKQNSADNRSVSREKKSPISDHSNSEIPQYSTSGVPNEEYNHKFSKGGDSFITGIIKKSLSRSSPLEKGKTKVSVNGHPIPDRLVKKAEKIAGVIQPGEYWYDYHAGFWGVIGQPCLGIIPPYIEEFNYPMSKKCSAGNTTIFVNGRELHSRDLNLLASRGLPTTNGSSYTIEISGAVRDANTGVELGTLGKLAPTIEKLRKGFGMKPPRVAAV